MKSHTFHSLALAGAFLVAPVIARADYANSTQVADAARLLFEKGDYPGARKITEEALSLAKTPHEKALALTRIGVTYCQEKRYVQAREQWAKVMDMAEASGDRQADEQIQADKAQALFDIAASYSQEDKHALARAQLEKILVMPGATNTGGLRMNIAKTYLAEGNLAQARQIFTDVAGDTSADVFWRSSAYAQLGKLLLDAKEFDAARTTFKSLLALNGALRPDRFAAKMGLIECYKAQGDPGSAQREAVEAQMEAMMASNELMMLKMYPQAREWREKILAIGQVDPIMDSAVRMQIAALGLVEGKPAEARAMIQTLMDKNYGPDLSAKDKLSVWRAREGAQLALAESYVMEKNVPLARQALQALLASEGLDAKIKPKAETMLQKLG